METKYIKIDYSGSGIVILRLTGWLSLIAGLFIATFMIISDPSILTIGLSVAYALGGTFVLGICLALATITESAIYLKEHIKNDSVNIVYQEE